MSATQFAQLDVETLRRVARDVGRVGVVGNDGDLRFDERSARASLDGLHAQLRETGQGDVTLVIGTPTRPHDDMDTLIYDTGRYGNLAEAEQAWEQDYHRRWHEQIELRANDWIERLVRLRSLIVDWLRTSDLSALTIVDQPGVTMSEEPMRRFAVPPRQMPAFEIRDGGRRVMRFQPKGLWIIGANGRVDLITRTAAPILVDQSAPLSGSSNWELYDPSDRGRSIPLTQQAFSALIHAAL